MDTPQEIPFLSILQHLLKIDPKEPVSDLIWDTAERLVHRATLLENKDDSQRLLRAPSQHKSLHRLKSMDNGLRKSSAETTPIPAPPPPPPGGAPPPLPPPPPPGGCRGTSRHNSGGSTRHVTCPVNSEYILFCFIVMLLY